MYVGIFSRPGVVNTVKGGGAWLGAWLERNEEAGELPLYGGRLWIVDHCLLANKIVYHNIGFHYIYIKHAHTYINIVCYQFTTFRRDGTTMYNKLYMVPLYII